MHSLFNKKWWLVTLFVLPLVCLVILIILRKNSPHPDLADFGGGKPLAKSRSDYVALESSWLTNNYQAFSDLDDESVLSRVKKLPIRYVGDELSRVQANSLDSALVKTLMSFKAKHFNDYLRSAVQDESYSFDPLFITGFGEVIAKSHRKTALSTQEVVEAWWRTNSNSGSWSEKISRGICWDQSFIIIENAMSKTDLDAQNFVEFLKRTIPNCGVVGTTSIFVYSPSPQIVFSSNKNIFVADIVLLSKYEFNGETTAFPLVLRYYWAPSIQKWLPFYTAWGYSGPVPPMPVF